MRLFGATSAGRSWGRTAASQPEAAEIVQACRYAGERFRMWDPFLFDSSYPCPCRVGEVFVEGAFGWCEGGRRTVRPVPTSSWPAASTSAWRRPRVSTRARSPAMSLTGVASPLGRPPTRRPADDSGVIDASRNVGQGCDSFELLDRPARGHLPSPRGSPATTHSPRQRSCPGFTGRDDGPQPLLPRRRAVAAGVSGRRFRCSRVVCAGPAATRGRRP